MFNIIVADDHPMTLLGTETYLKTLNHRIIGSFNNGVSCLNGILTLMPDLAIIDINMPGLNGLEILENLKKHRTKTKIILLTLHNELSVYIRAKELGAKGFIIKESAALELSLCIQKVMLGEDFVSQEINQGLMINKNDSLTSITSSLTRTEKKIIELISANKSNIEIAKFLFISERTVESHKRNICEKLNLPKGKNMLLVWAMKNNIE